MNHKLVASLFLVANAMVVSGLAQHHPNRHSLTTVSTDDGTQPPAPPPGRNSTALLADGTLATGATAWSRPQPARLPTELNHLHRHRAEVQLRWR